MPSYLSSFLLNREERSLRAIRLLDNKLIFLFLILIFFIDNGALLFILRLFFELIQHLHGVGCYTWCFIGRWFVGAFDVYRIDLLIKSRLHCYFLYLLLGACVFSTLHEWGIFLQAFIDPLMTHIVHDIIFLTMIPDWMVSSSLRSYSVRVVMQLPSMDSYSEWRDVLLNLG